jgi:hypothetical protein
MSNKLTLGTWMDGGAAKIDLPRLIESRGLIQANSGGGKSWALRRMMEVTSGHVQQIIIDPEGEFSTLREKHDLVIAAATNGDALAHPKTARLLAIRLLETQASAVLDLYDLKSHDRHLFVKLFLEALVDSPKNLWHPVLIVIDEAHVYCPEKGQGESIATEAVIDIASRGRKRGLSMLAATQRIGKFNKSAAAELKNKLIGSTGLDIDVKRAAFELGLQPKEALEKLRPLQSGHFFAFGPAFSQVDPRELITGPVETTHPKVGHRQLLAPPKPTEAIKALLPKLADLPKEAEEEAKTVEELRRENARLKKEARSAPIVSAPAPVIDKAQLRRDLDGAFRDGISKGCEIASAAIQGKLSAIARAGDDMIKSLRAIAETQIQPPAKLPARSSSSPVVATVHPQKVHRSPETMRAIGDTVKQSGFPAWTGEQLPTGEAAVLRACIQFSEGLRREQLTVLTGYKRSSRDAYIARLKQKGFVEESGALIIAAELGIAAMPEAEPLPTGTALQEFWMKRLPEGEKACLKVLIDAYPEDIERNAIDDHTNYKRSSRDAYLARLSAKQLVSEPNRGRIRASDTLFQ